jgi:hypothetical protein
MPDVVFCALGCRNKATQTPYLADPGYQTCRPCADRLRDVLRDIVARSPQIAAPAAIIPARSVGERPPPGYSSRSPANDHMICLRDPRTVAVEPGDPHSALSDLAYWAGRVRRERGHSLLPDRRTVETEAQTIRFNWDWVCGRVWVATMADDLRAVLDQLKSATGDPRPRHIGRCPNPVADPAAEPGQRPCGTRLYAPLHGDTVECRACSRTWERREWLQLGLLLTSEAS